MSFKVIQGFDVAKAEPADIREKVANQAARLAIAFPFKGLTTYQIDTGEYYEYIGDDTQQPPPNTSGDWIRRPVLYYASGVPSNSLGVNGDYAIDETGGGFYKKSTGTWSSIFSFAGANILTGAGVPASGLGVTGDLYVKSDGDVYKKTDGTTWALQFNIRGTDGQSDQYATTSTTSINLTTATAPLALTIGTGLAYTVGQSVVVASRSDNGDNLTGDVVSYNSGTGALVLNNLTINGTATKTDWDVNLSGAPGVQGKGFIHTESNITLTQAKITTVQSGGYTPQNPYSASVLNDTRTPGELTATPGINGSMVGNSIAYDGTNWYNNGVWRGPKGDQGAQGIQGIQGNNGANGVTPNLGVGSVATGNAGTSAVVTRSGTLTDPLFNFTIPRGDKGDKGDPGIGDVLDFVSIGFDGGTYNLNMTERKHYIIGGTGTLNIIGAVKGAFLTVRTFYGAISVVSNVSIDYANDIWDTGQTVPIHTKASHVTFRASSTNVLQPIGEISVPVSSINNILSIPEFPNQIGLAGSVNNAALIGTGDIAVTANRWRHILSFDIDCAVNNPPRVFLDVSLVTKTSGANTDFDFTVVVVGGPGAATANTGGGNEQSGDLLFPAGTHLLAMENFYVKTVNARPSFTINGVTINKDFSKHTVRTSFLALSDTIYPVKVYLFSGESFILRQGTARYGFIRIEKNG